MIRLENVNKYFNKRKKNEIRAIDDTSLELGKKGLTCLLGPSGCGKTTLLNAIGGLDRVDSGSIYVNGKRLTKRGSGKVDEIRNVEIGYIFQNYNLIDDMTVFDNVAIALKMTGMKSSSQIKKRVDYALSVVGMYRYRRRYADMLSGGERQRVGIARAIVKDPAVIIADEPTGNLDSRNTMDVMNIIKSISRTRLVVLVTHEEKLAEFYADRIIRLKDGRVISDETNRNRDELDYRIDSNIYLGDMRSHESFSSGNVTVDLYSDGKKDTSLKIVIRDGNVYIQPGKGSRAEIIDNGSGIRLIDGKYREFTKDDFFKNRFDPGKLKRSGAAEYTSIISFGRMLKDGFRKTTAYKPLKKVLLAGFFISAMFVMYSLCNIAGVMNIDDSRFVTVNRNYLKIDGSKIKPEKYDEYASLDGIGYLIPGDSRIGLSVAYDDYLQTGGAGEILKGSLTDIGNISKSDIIQGRMPENSGEIAVDRLACRRFISGDEGEGQFSASTAKMAGISKSSDLLGRKAKAGGIPALTIVGITDRKEPCIYAQKALFMQLVSGSVSDAESGDGSDVSYADTGGEEDGSTENQEGGRLVDYNEYDFKGGTRPENDYEAVVSESRKSEIPVGKTIDRKVDGHRLKVIGYYRGASDDTMILVNTRTFEHSVIEAKSGITVYAKDRESVKNVLEQSGAKVEDPYENAKAEYQKKRKDTVKSALILALVMLAISIIEIFLIMRASFLSRIREIGVLRAIGVKKTDIRRMFLGEIIAVTVFADVPGFILMSYIVSRLEKAAYLAGNFLIDPWVMCAGMLLLLAVNILFGLLPVNRLLCGTPAEILARNDAEK